MIGCDDFEEMLWVFVPQGDAAPGTASPNVASAGHMSPAMSEAALYTQLSHFQRLLDSSLALSRLKDDAERQEATRYLSAHLVPSVSPLVRFRTPQERVLSMSRGLLRMQGSDVTKQRTIT